MKNTLKTLDFTKKVKSELCVCRLVDCGISDEGCAALKQNPSHLRQLQLVVNKIGDWGKKQLTALKDDEHLKLHELMRK